MSLRYEQKYLVPNEQMPELRQRLRPFLIMDSNARNTTHEINQYTVRSIYLDSYNMECYLQKESGIKLRRKLRIRGYNQLHEDSRVVFEIKRKIGGRIKKHRSMIFFKNLEEVILFGNIEDHILTDGNQHSLDEAKRFFFHLKKKNYTPSNLVAYEREPFHGKLDRNVRITFDKNIRSKASPKYSELYTEHGLKPLFNHHFVMEIKYFTNEMPGWARSIVHEFGLRKDAISKYTIGYDVAKYNKKLTY